MLTNHAFKDVRKSVFIALGFMFVLLSVVVIYAAFSTNTDNRSRAAQEVTIIKEWNFNTDLEGWKASGTQNKVTSVKDGSFTLPFRAWDKPIVCQKGQRCSPPSPRQFVPVISKLDVHTVLKYPINILRVRLAVLPDNMSVIAPFYLQLDQKIQGKSYYGVKKIENVIADGKEHEYQFRFPSETNLKTLETLELSFRNLGKYTGGKIRINDIALVGMSEEAMISTSPMLTPTTASALPTETIKSAPMLSCPTSGAFQASSPIAAYQFTYPAVVRAKDNMSWLMVTGGIFSRMPESIRGQAPNGEGHARFPVSQEELWISKSSDLTKWSTPNFSFNILPETTVSFKQNKSYKDVYPSGFKTGCSALPNGACNVQINDPSIVRYNGSLYMYFTILENYRWYDGSVALDDTKERNRHSIGLAVSGDDGEHWAFVDKIIPESTTDTDGQTVLGAWAPSAIVVDDRVDVYFHDAFGTKQYVAQLKGGVTISQLNRLNKKDSTYRVNVDVIKNGAVFEMLYNDANFNIARTYFSGPDDFGGLCGESIVVAANGSTKWPTPHQVIDGTKTHLFFWQMEDPTYNHHWVRN